MTVVVTALAFVFWYPGVERLGVERAGLFAGIVPVSALLSAAATGESSFTLGRMAVAAGVSVGVTRDRVLPTEHDAAGNRLKTRDRKGSLQLPDRERLKRHPTSSRPRAAAPGPHAGRWLLHRRRRK
jgi:hypothetical protein